MRPGEFLAIVGKSGTGKSTLLNMMAGHLDADKGTISFREEPIQGPADRLVPGYEEIQLVHQQFELQAFMSAEENIRRPILGYVKEYQENKVNELLALSGLANKRSKKPSELSGGQQQKLALSTAMAVEPQVLLMDEPFSNLDPFSKQAFLREIKQMAVTYDCTAIFVTHDTRDALSVADRILVLDEGTIIQEGTPREVYESPVNVEVGRFFGPLNVFSPKEWNTVFGMKSKTQIGVRPEQFLWSWLGNGTQVVVRDTLFSGEVNHILVEAPGRREWIEVQCGIKPPERGQEIFLSIAEHYPFPKK